VLDDGTVPHPSSRPAAQQGGPPTQRICLSHRRFVLERLVRQEKPLQRFVQTALVIGTVAAGALFATAGSANAATPGELTLNPATDCPDLAQYWPAGPDECVQALQQDLHLMGASLGEDGFFGPQTQRAVMGFLSRFGLNPTGVADLDTRHSPQEDVDAKQQTAGYDPIRGHEPSATPSAGPGPGQDR
jgi:peptidoglycan hydrolase-like protein with peptidoglycan-binding domain